MYRLINLQKNEIETTQIPGRHGLACLVIFLVTFTLYLVSTPVTVVLEDDGLFILASYFNGISHSPGYPLFTFLGHLATLLPVGSLAFRVHALSALFGSLACVTLYWVALLLFRDRFLAVAAAIALGISRTFWSQAIISEVYTLNVLIYLVLLLALIIYTYQPGRINDRLLYFCFFVYGLGLSNHWPLLALSTPSLVIIAWPRIRHILKCLPIGICLLVLGLLPYLWMYIRSQMDPVISFYGPLNSLQELWYMISRKGYAGIDQSLTSNYLDKLYFCLFALQQSAWQLGPLTAVFALAGFIRQWQQWKPHICLGLLFAFLGNTFLLALLLGFDFTPLFRNIFKVYPVIAYTVVCLWVISGVQMTVTLIRRHISISVSKRQSLVIMSCLVLITGLVSSLPYNYRANDRLAHDYALTILETLEQDAIFFTGGDLETGALGYLNLIEGIRPDVTLMNVRSLVFNNRLENPMRLNFEDSHRTLSNFILTTDRPIYFINSLPNIYGIRDYGLYRMIDKSIEKDTVSLILERPEIKNFYESILQAEKVYDTWENLLHTTLISDYCRISMHLYFADDPGSHKDEIFRICRGYYGLMSAVSAAMIYEEVDVDYISLILDRAGDLLSDAKSPSDLAQYYKFRGLVFQKQGETELARQSLMRSVEIWSDTSNPAYKHLQEITESMNNTGPAG